jgi:radical SAM superfamily enzyme YgiQ (UPF0313 family)
MLPGNQYSATLGYIQAAAQAQPDLANALTFRRHIKSQSPDGLEREYAQIMAAMDDPLVVAFTIYFWNRPASLELARRVKERWPACKIVVGGNDVTNQQDAVFAEAPWVDVLAHGEGEVSFVELLRQFLRAAPDGDRPAPDGDRGTLADIRGISYQAGPGNIITTPAAERIVDLETVPSPILSSVFSDAEMAATRVFVYETNRGCPYSCAFCYWGGATNSKVRQFSLERIEAELDRIIRLAQPGAQIFIADANFGIVARDVEIARLIVDTCQRYKKRVIVLTNWAKNTSDRVVTIAHMLRQAGLTGAITLSAQSFDPEVLQIANRSNIRVDHYRRMQQRFRELDVPTYTDLIWGLPGQGPESYRESIEEALSAGGSPVIYPLLLLNNTEYTKERFRSDYRIKARHLPCNPGVDALTADVVIAHSAMTYDEWVDGMMLRLSLGVFQKSLLRCTLRILSHYSGVRIVDLCQRLVAYLDTECSDPGIVALARNHARSWREPEGYDRPRVVAETGPIMVIAEELHFQAIVARMVRDPEKLKRLLTEAVDFLLSGLDVSVLPAPEEIDAVLGLDLAGAAALRAGLLGRTEETSFRIGAESLAVLQAFGEVPTGFTAEGTFSVSVERTRYPFSGYYISVWHGSGRPLHDLTLSAPSQRNILELA